MVDNKTISVEELIPNGIATTKQEPWKYVATKLSTAVKKPFQIIDTAILESHIAHADKKDAFTTCVFVNGIYFASVSDALPEGVTISTDSELSLREEHPLAEVSKKIESQVTCIEVAPQAIIEKPLYIYHITAGKDAYNNTRLHIKLGKNSISKIFEYHKGKDKENTCWTNRIQQVDVEQDALCDHYVLQAENNKTVFTSFTEVNLADKAQYNHYSFSLGAAIARNEIHTHINGSHVESDTKGLFLGKDTQYSEYYLPTTHHNTHSISRQKIYGILDDQAQGTFFGKVIVPQNSQHTESHQMNKNVLLSSKAQVNSRPELEVYADDVECSHGSATGELDSMALYYLQARGLNKEQAQHMLIDGFMHEIVNAVSHDSIREIIEAEVDTWLKQ